MPTFDTPGPIVVSVDICGDTTITASDRTDTVVTVSPTNPARPADVKGAGQTRVDFAEGHLVVKLARRWAPFGPSESIQVTIEVPTGSELDGVSALGDFRGEGELGPCRAKTSMGSIRFDRTGPLRASTAFGNIVVDHVAGDAEVSTSSGDIRVGRVDGRANAKNSNGMTELGQVAGDVGVKAANGDVVVGRAGASVTARTANGSVRADEVSRGVVVLETAAGQVEVGVADGTAAWLDVNTRFGTVRSGLEATGGPEQSDHTVEVRARSSFGDIIINRVPAGTAGTAGSS
jgi:hypothetical protein